MEQYRQWLRELGGWVYRYAQKTIWGMLLYKVLEDRVMGWANQTIDSTLTSPGWTETVKSALIAFDNTGLGFYWNLVALTFFVILLLAAWNTRSTPPSPKVLSLADNTLDHAEQKQRFLQLASPIMNKVCSRMQQVMGLLIYKALLNQENMSHHYVKAVKGFMQPLEDSRTRLHNFLIEKESLSNDDFACAQQLVVTCYTDYEKRRLWVQDIGWEFFPEFSTYFPYKEWKAADDDMRRQLKKLLRDCDILAEKITDLDPLDPLRWREK